MSHYGVPPPHLGPMDMDANMSTLPGSSTNPLMRRIKSSPVSLDTLGNTSSKKGPSSRQLVSQGRETATSTHLPAPASTHSSHVSSAAIAATNTKPSVLQLAGVDPSVADSPQSLRNALAALPSLRLTKKKGLTLTEEERKQIQQLKQQRRLARKAEAARVSRRKKKTYIQTLEQALAQLKDKVSTFKQEHNVTAAEEAALIAQINTAEEEAKLKVKTEQVEENNNPSSPTALVKKEEAPSHSSASSSSSSSQTPAPSTATPSTASSCPSNIATSPSSANASTPCSSSLSSSIASSTSPILDNYAFRRERLLQLKQREVDIKQVISNLQVALNLPQTYTNTDTSASSSNSNSNSNSNNSGTSLSSTTPGVTTTTTSSSLSTSPSQHTSSSLTSNANNNNSTLKHNSFELLLWLLSPHGGVASALSATGTNPSTVSNNTSLASPLPTALWSDVLSTEVGLSSDQLLQLQALAPLASKLYQTHQSFTQLFGKHGQESLPSAVLAHLEARKAQVVQLLDILNDSQISNFTQFADFLQNQQPAARANKQAHAQPTTNTTPSTNNPASTSMSTAAHPQPNLNPNTMPMTNSVATSPVGASASTPSMMVVSSTATTPNTGMTQT